MTKLPPVLSQGRVLSRICLYMLCFAGCVASRATGLSDSGTEHLALVRYNGLTIPADLGPVPTRDGGVSECHTVVSGGTLTINVRQAHFAYDYNVQDTCTQTSVGHLALAGSVTQDGASLVFRVPRVLGTTTLDTVVFSGTRVSGSIVIRPGGRDELVYQ